MAAATVATMTTDPARKRVHMPRFGGAPMSGRRGAGACGAAVAAGGAAAGGFGGAPAGAAAWAAGAAGGAPGAAGAAAGAARAGGAGPETGRAGSRSSAWVFVECAAARALSPRSAASLASSRSASATVSASTVSPGAGADGMIGCAGPPSADSAGSAVARLNRNAVLCSSNR